MTRHDGWYRRLQVKPQADCAMPGRSKLLSRGRESIPSFQVPQKAFAKTVPTISDCAAAPGVPPLRPR